MRESIRFALQFHCTQKVGPVLPYSRFPLSFCFHCFPSLPRFRFKKYMHRLLPLCRILLRNREREREEDANEKFALMLSRGKGSEWGNLGFQIRWSGGRHGPSETDMFSSFYFTLLICFSPRGWGHVILGVYFFKMHPHVGKNTCVTYAKKNYAPPFPSL